MTHPTHAASCGCCQSPMTPGLATRAEQPRTLNALLASGSAATLLDADAETLAMLLPLFDRVSATTVGPYALLSERGGYGPAQIVGRPPRRCGARIGLRLAAGRAEMLVRTPADPQRRLPAALHLFGADGHVMHRTEIAAPEDLATLDAMARQLDSTQPLLPVPPAPVTAQPVSLPAIRAARDRWWLAPAHAHQDDLALDGGRGRLSCLPHVGAAAARRIDPRSLGGFLERLAHRGQAFTRGLARPGCLQEHAGEIEAFSRNGSVVVMRSGASLMALDLSGVAQAWLTHRDHGSVVELYDATGLAVAHFAAAGAVHDWRHLTGWLSDAAH